MTPEGMIEVPADKLLDLIKLTYELSEPVGMGFMHYRAGPLDEDDAKIILNEAKTRGPSYYGGDDLGAFINIDYLHGRCCKMVVFKMKDADRYFIRENWYDHTSAHMQKLLDGLGVNHDVEPYDIPEHRRQG